MASHYTWGKNSNCDPYLQGLTWSGISIHWIGKVYFHLPACTISALRLEYPVLDWLLLLRSWLKNHFLKRPSVFFFFKLNTYCCVPCYWTHFLSTSLKHFLLWKISDIYKRRENSVKNTQTPRLSSTIIIWYRIFVQDSFKANSRLISL